MSAARIPIVAKMIRHDDGTYSVDKTASTYAEAQTVRLAELLRREYDRQQRENVNLKN